MNTTPRETVKCNSEFFVYLLVSDSGATYIGATVNLDRRLRQHNKEITGGAHATGSKVKKGESWVRACHVKNFPDWSSALQFEWRWKQISRKLSRDLVPLERRYDGINQNNILVCASCWNSSSFFWNDRRSKALAYKDWPNGTTPVLETIWSWSRNRSLTGLFLDKL